MLKQTKMDVYPNAVLVRSHNKAIAIERRKPKNQHDSKNVIFLKSLTADTTKNPGVIHELSKNEKIKYSTLGLSDDAIVALYHCLGEYLEKFGRKV